jgi:hypothetical protein
MSSESCEVIVKVLWLSHMSEFDGKAVLADLDPRFVVGLLLHDSEEIHTLDGSGIQLPFQQVAFFAIRSPTKLFMASDVVGQKYRIRVEARTVNGVPEYSLSRVT